MGIVGVIAINVIFWTGAYTIGKKVVVPMIQGVKDGIKDAKKELKEEKKEKKAE